MSTWPPAAIITLCAYNAYGQGLGASVRELHDRVRPIG